MAILKDLAESMWLVKRPNPRSCGVVLGMQCDCCGSFTADQREAIHCVSAHMSMLYMAVLLRNDDVVDDLIEHIVLRLQRLWARVSYYLETGSDSPAKADPPPSYSDSEENCLLASA